MATKAKAAAPAESAPQVDAPEVGPLAAPGAGASTIELARYYGQSQRMVIAVKAANPTTAATRLVQARKYGTSEWVIKGIVDAARAAPGAPTNVVAAITGATGVAVVSFRPGSDSGSPITTFVVTSSVGAKTGNGASSPVTVTGLTAGAQTFTVTATNVIGTSVASVASNSVTVP